MGDDRADGSADVRSADVRSADVRSADVRSADVRLAGRAWAGLPAAPLVLVPVGSCEQHGPHLPLTTDTTIAVAVAGGSAEHLLRAHADRADRADRADPAVLVAPPVVYTASGEHQGFPGTMSIGGDVLRLVLVELVRSMSGWCGRVVFVNGHGGNLRALATAVTQLRREGHDVTWVSCETPPEAGAGGGAGAGGEAGAGGGAGGGGGDGDSHAGFSETSLMLHLAPHEVDLSRAQAGNTAPLAELMPAIVAGGVAAVAPSGVLGDPTGATAHAGERLLRGMIEHVSMLISGGAADVHGRLRPPAPPPAGPVHAAGPVRGASSNGGDGT